ncbi:hypothetical protein M413DRAFT_445082 [Hebeloma cylindrosporum]|uniref:Membrane insertase YidC/Oxa/ALB C-terminal domain-containing protein n=1 Tax=Hebeloma cylindrosporum TaxID=76867 RepID=A0A0C3CE30_HEBCY|nr:hypothetical protein M413DRAFT_445082 [Hebeloma cylindrosporum h7]
MALASSAGLGVRYGSLRVTTSRSSALVPLSVCHSNTRLFSSLRPTNSSRTLLLTRKPCGARNLSLWGWGSSKSTPSKAPESEVAASSPETSTAVPELSKPTEGVDSAVDATVSTTDASVIPVDAVTQGVSDTQPFLSEVTETIVNNTPAALQYGDLAAMGLAGWSPAGIVRWSFELIHVTAGLPWFWTIVAGSVLWRAVSVPFAIKGLQATARLQPHQAKMKAFQQMMQDAQASKNRLEIQKATLAMRAFYEKNNINPLAALIPMIQMPITLGVFFGVKKLCTLEQLQISGLSFLPDLTVADPTYILPTVMLAAIHTQIYLGVRDINTTERPGMGHLMNGIRVISAVSIPFMAAFPSGLLISLITTASLTTLQTLVLRSSAVRRRLQIAIVPKKDWGRLPSIAESLRFLRDTYLSPSTRPRPPLVKQK